MVVRVEGKEDRDAASAVPRQRASTTDSGHLDLAEIVARLTATNRGRAPSLLKEETALAVDGEERGVASAFPRQRASPTASDHQDLVEFVVRLAATNRRRATRLLKEETAFVVDGEEEKGVASAVPRQRASTTCLGHLDSAEFVVRQVDLKAPKQLLAEKSLSASPNLVG